MIFENMQYTKFNSNVEAKIVTDNRAALIYEETGAKLVGNPSMGR